MISAMENGGGGGVTPTTKNKRHKLNPSSPHRAPYVDKSPWERECRLANKAEIASRDARVGKARRDKQRPTPGQEKLLHLQLPWKVKKKKSREQLAKEAKARAEVKAQAEAQLTFLYQLTGGSFERPEFQYKDGPIHADIYSSESEIEDDDHEAKPGQGGQIR